MGWAGACAAGRGATPQGVVSKLTASPAGLLPALAAASSCATAPPRPAPPTPPQVFYVAGGAEAWREAGLPWKEPVRLALPDLSNLTLTGTVNAVVRPRCRRSWAAAGAAAVAAAGAAARAAQAALALLLLLLLALLLLLLPVRAGGASCVMGAPPGPRRPLTANRPALAVCRWAAPRRWPTTSTRRPR